jgi:hypothetical protein
VKVNTDLLSGVEFRIMWSSASALFYAFTPGTGQLYVINTMTRNVLFFKHKFNLVCEYLHM